MFQAVAIQVVVGLEWDGFVAAFWCMRSTSVAPIEITRTFSFARNICCKLTLLLGNTKQKLTFFLGNNSKNLHFSEGMTKKATSEKFRGRQKKMSQFILLFRVKQTLNLRCRQSTVVAAEVVELAIVESYVTRINGCSSQETYIHIRAPL